MRHYELVLLITPEATEERVGLVQDKVKRFVADQGGEITHDEHWGKRRLAYKIGRHGEGFYHLTEFTLGDKQHAKDLENILNLTEDVIRYLVTRKEPKQQPENKKQEAKPEAAPAQA